jgi:sulfite reductase (NADPH) flavoprotein alpha-component
MSVPVLPDNAPFTAAQRAWLNGFFAGVLSLEAASTSGAGDVGSADMLGSEGTGAEDDFPWHDPALQLGERIALAEGRPVEQQMMAAMAQLDCGTCGYLCRTYAQAIVRGDEQSLTRCTPGGRETARQLKQLVAQAAT